MVSAVLVLSCGQTDRQTDRITEADQRYTHATTVGVSKYENRAVYLQSKYVTKYSSHYLVVVPDRIDDSSVAFQCHEKNEVC